MKINVQKLQAGGGIPVYKPLPMLPSAPPTPQAAADSPIKDDLMDKMVGKGITSDVMVYADQVKNAYQQYSSLPEAIRNSPEGQMLRMQMKGDWAKLNMLERSRNRFDNILNDRKRAMPETAIYHGKVIAQDQTTGDIVPLSFTEYAQSMQGDRKFRALTNSELAHIRENDLRYAGRNEFFDILENSISTDEVTKEVRGVLQNLGSFAKGDTDVSYEEKQIGEGANGLLNKGLSYIKTSEGSFIESNRQNIKMASNAMWANLSDNAKDLLRAKAVAYGYTPDKIETAAMGLAVSLLDPATKELVKTTSGDLPGKGGSGAGKGQVGQAGVYQQASSFQTPMKQIQLNVGSNKSAIMKAWEMPNFAKQNGEWRGPEFIENIPELNSITDMSQGAYIGDQFVKKENFGALLWDGHSGQVVFMPVKFDDKNQRMMPDVEATQRLSEAEKEISKYGKTIPKEIKKEIYYKNGFSELDENGDPIVGRTVYPFMTFTGSINEVLIDNPNSNMLHQNSGDEDKFYEDKYMKDSKGKSVSRPGHGFFAGLPHGWSTGSVTSTVFIPMKLGAPYTAQIMEQKGIGVPKEETTSGFYDRVGWIYKQDPKMGAVQQMTKDNTVESLNK